MSRKTCAYLDAKIVWIEKSVENGHNSESRSFHRDRIIAYLDVGNKWYATDGTIHELPKEHRTFMSNYVTSTLAPEMNTRNEIRATVVRHVLNCRTVSWIRALQKLIINATSYFGEHDITSRYKSADA